MDRKKIDVLLVENVRKHRCLYDRNSIGFKSKTKRDEAWTDIVVNLGGDATTLKTRWRTIRDRFVKTYSKKLAEGISDEVFPFEDWYLLPHLQFLVIEYTNSGSAIHMPQKKIELNAAINDEQLIAEVKKYSLIYARNTLTYNNKQKRAEAWANISSALATEEEICQRRWRSIRDRYAKICSRRNMPGYVIDDKDDSWYLMPQLEFLNDYLQKRKPLEFVQIDEEFEVVDVDDSSAEPSNLDDYAYSYDTLKSPSNASCTSPESKRRKIETAIPQEPEVSGNNFENVLFQQPDVHEQMCSILDRIKNITNTKSNTDQELVSNKNLSFLKLVDEKLLKIPNEKREDAKMFVLNYLHKLSRD